MRPLLRVRDAIACLPALALACAGSEPPPSLPVPEPEPVALDEGEPLPLQVLAATSGVGVQRVIDQDPATSWTPVPDPSQEGVLLRLESPTALASVQVEGCPLPEAQVQLFADSTSLGQRRLDQGSAEFAFSPAAGEVRSLYLRLLGPVGSCLSEVRLQGAGGERLRPLPPRQVTGRLEASSVLAPSAAYQPAFLFDGRTHFAWAEGAEGDGVGQRLDIRFDEPQRLLALEIWNGYQRSDDHFSKNARLLRLRASADSGSAELVLADAAGPQRLALEPPLEGQTLSLEVLEVAGGQRYPDLVVSELRFHDEQGPFGLQTPDLALAEAALRQELRGSPLEAVVGRVMQSRCEPRLGTLKLRRDASFVWYGEPPGEPAAEGKSRKEPPAQEILDGAWAIERKEGPWARLGLYARRHRVEPIWQPYSEARPSSSTLTSGGALELALARDLGPRLQEELRALGRGPAASRVACVDSDELLHELVTSGAVLVKGAALTDLLVPAP